MKIQTIIPILDPQSSFFNKTITALHVQTVKSSMLLINSGNPISPGNFEVAKIDKTTFNHANTRNFALKYEADFYLFMTQDALPYDEHLIEELLKVFEDEEIVVSYARQIPYEDADAIEVFARTTNYPARSR
ncbi:MAG: hypothetical protein EOM50_19605, partial [Erysipelotrichia bacterium]|nr:hypothetical protein [Erysipelotrichia bacterium]